MKSYRLTAVLAGGIIALCAVLGGCSGDSSNTSSAGTSSAVTTTVKTTEVSQTTPKATTSETSTTVTETPKQTDETTTTTSKQTTADLPDTTPETTKAPETEAPETDPPATDRPVTAAPETDPPVTDPPATEPPATDPPQTDPPQTEPSPSYIITPTADAVTVYQNDDAVIDASNASQGYLMIKLSTAMDGSYRILVNADDINVRYTFQLNSSGNYEVIPLTEGSGNYTVSVLKVTSAGKGTVMFKQSLSVSVSDSFLPFLTPNQFCMYDADSSCVALSSQLCGGNKDTIEKTAAIYDYVIKNISYVSTAENAANGYIPVPDTTLANKSGICFDYASLMAAMLRSQKIPTKVVVGYAGDVYHAWISVYVEGSGWIDGYIYFDGNSWNRMDPTFAAGAKDEADYKNLVSYISDGSHYSDMYYY